MRLILAGGRHLTDAGLVTRALDRAAEAHALTVLIHGGHALTGQAAEDWARRQGLHVIRYPPNWQLHGRRAEGLRNAFMLADSRPDLMLALPGGADTADLIARARGIGLPVQPAGHGNASDPPDDPLSRGGHPSRHPAFLPSDPPPLRRGDRP
ncbi:DUF2493 domain-containing protein [Rhodobacter calidifons]|uniref:DUF2493 domain-containing protein n=1 Tax=Rhodobacter calidifons TaxID=2715277 RepID=A0ABX0GDR7_9RHOB|nr:DUF2493 domain-containing protein [Rhodobacter calidifons]NHB78571.1 DUF2493 domain-containing protein [Rhodobacter calidifons]